jgi:hypothetical protein
MIRGFSLTAARVVREVMNGPEAAATPARVTTRMKPRRLMFTVMTFRRKD